MGNFIAKKVAYLVRKTDFGKQTPECDVRHKGKEEMGQILVEL